MLKPNAYTNDAADLKNYEISFPIQEILNNFDTVADEVLKDYMVLITQEEGGDYG